MCRDYLFLSVIFILGFFIVKDDIKFRRIRNKYVFAGLSAGAFLYFACFFSGSVSADYMLKVAVNSSISLAVGFLIWRLNFWPAGDAKLFFILSLLLPLKYFSNSYLPYFPSFIILLNSFICALIFLLPILVWKTAAKIRTGGLNFSTLPFIVRGIFEQELRQSWSFSPFLFAGTVLAVILRGWVMFWLR